MAVSNDIKDEITRTVHNTLDFCGDVQGAVLDVLDGTSHNINDPDIQDIIFAATMSYGK